MSLIRHWYDGQWWVREKDVKVWRCVECGHVLTGPRDDCPKCMGDVISFVPQYDAGAVVLDDAAITRAADAIGALGTDRIGVEPYAAARAILDAARDSKR